MAESLADLEHQRGAIWQQILRLPDFRSGSITVTRGTAAGPMAVAISRTNPDTAPTFACGCFSRLGKRLPLWI
jgi:hypothetical protein